MVLEIMSSIAVASDAIVLCRKGKKIEFFQQALDYANKGISPYQSKRFNMKQWLQKHFHVSAKDSIHSTQFKRFIILLITIIPSVLIAYFISTLP